MIIIKSQIGIITEVSSIEPEFNNGVIFGMIKGTEKGLVLGQGYSEERAKEVMEEIEVHIGKVQWAKCHGNSDVVVQEAGWIGGNEFIYTMPKE